MGKKPIVKKPAKHGKDWSAFDINQLRQLARENTPTPIVARKLKRTPAAVQQKASQERISLKPTNKTPYNRRGK